MDPITISLGIGLYEAFKKVAEKALIDPSLEKGLEPFKQWLTKGYDQQKDAEELNNSLLAALDDLCNQYPRADLERLIATLKLTGLNQEQHTALAAAVIEMSHPEPTLVPDDLLKTLDLDENHRQMLARFLFHLRGRLALSDKYKDAIRYADRLDQRGLLVGLSQQFLDLQKQLTLQLSLFEKLVALCDLNSDDKQKQALKDYLDWARQKWGSLSLPLIRKRSGDMVRDASLKQVFVPLKMRDVAAEEEARRKSSSLKSKQRIPDEQEKQVPPIDLGGLVNRYDRFIIVGVPGCGKTTLLHRLALAFAEGRAGDDLDWKGQPLLPILTRLRNFGAFLAENKDKYPAPCSGSLVAFLENQVHDGERIQLTPNFFDQRLKEGVCIVLLDGLDEVSENRSEVAQHLCAFIDTYGKIPGNRFGISSRPRGYEMVEVYLNPARLSLVEVLPLDEAGIRALNRNLFSLIEPDLRQQSRDTDRLTRNILSRPDLTKIASTPLFCSALVQVYKYHPPNLPERRVEVLEEIVDLLLGYWKAQQQVAGAEMLASADGTGKTRRLEESVNVKRQRLSFLAYQMQEKRLAEIDCDIAASLLADYLRERERIKDEDICCEWAEEFLSNSHEYSGLLVEHEPGKYSFLHTNFMEYLAATWLVNRSEVIPVALAHWMDDWWEQVILLAGAHPKLPENFRSDLVNQILDQTDEAKDEVIKTNLLVLAGKLAADMAETLPGVDHERVEEALLSELGGRSLGAKNRAQVGITLAYLGDPRPEVMTVDGMRFCFVPEGEFWFGEGSRARKINLPAFWMGEYPISNAQFAEFVQEDGYQNADWWKEAWNANYWSEKGFKGRYDDETCTEPDKCRDSFGLPNHPVVGVSWYEALAFTRWLRQRWQQKGWLPEGRRVSLPAEQQWEKATRGGLEIPAQASIFPYKVSSILEIQSKIGAFTSNPAPKRDYPWEDGFDPDLANTNETGLGNTSALGCFPLGASPYGIQDLSGNVWEWQKDWYDKNKDTKVLCGGSWGNYQDVACVCWFHNNLHPDFWSVDVGFRCALCEAS